MAFEDRTDPGVEVSAPVLRKWGGLASFLLAAAFIVAPMIYLFGNLQTTAGPFAYDLADFLYGPVWAASLVTMVLALRERTGGRASRRMSTAVLAALLAAGAMTAVACIRSANRHYHLAHPELHLEASSAVLVVWTTLVAGVTAAGWHFFGWVLVLAGSAGWTSRRLPRLLSALYVAGGAAAWFVYLLPELEGAVTMAGVVVAIWQGILFWKAGPGEAQGLEEGTAQPDPV